MAAHGQPPASSHHLVIDTAQQALSLSRPLHHHRLHLFYGDLHNHTGYSDGTGQPEDALRQMRDAACISLRSLIMASILTGTPRSILPINGPPSPSKQLLAAG